jgi:hypothetical protein
MTRFLIRLALPFLVLFTTSIGLIRARPYDDHGLRDLLLPPGCPAPCFAGIRPGVTTGEAAYQILQGYTWVDSLEIMIDTSSSEVDITARNLFIHWRQHQPTLLNQYVEGYIAVRSGIVTFTTVSTYFMLGDIQLSLGELPDREQVTVWYQRYVSDRAVDYTAIYENKGMMLNLELTCPVVEPYRALATLRFDDDLRAFRGDNVWRDIYRGC